MLSSRIPISAMAANDAETDCQQWLDSGMDDYMAKPVSFAGLVLALKFGFRPKRRPIHPLTEIQV